MADGQIIIDINADPSEYRRALDLLRSESRSAAGSISSAFEKAGASIQGIGDALTVGITTPMAVGAGAAGKFSYEALKSAEQVDIAFGTMLGPKRGQEMLESLYNFAASTPFEVRGLSTATQKMLAYGFSAEDVIPLLTSVGDATAGLGAGQEGIDSVTRAMGQMQAKGKVMSEEMLQLTEVGIPAWQYLADEITGGDIPAAMEEVTYGFVSADTAIAALRKGMDRDFGGMMSKQAETLTGIISNMGDAAYKAVVQAKDTDGYEDMTDALSELSGEIGPFVESLLPILEDLLSGAAGVARGAAGAMEDFSKMSEDGRRNVVGLIAGAAGLGPTMSVAGRALQIAGSAAGSFGGGLDRVKSAAGKARSGASAVAKTVDDAALAFQIARAHGDGMASSLSSGAAQMGRTASATGVLSAGLKGLQAGLLGIIGIGVAASLAAIVSELVKADEMARLTEESTIRLSDVTAEASASLSDASESSATAAEGYRNVKDDVDGLVRSQAELARQSADAWSETLANAEMVDQYRDTILKLADQTGLTADEQAELKTAVQGFNDLCGTSISVIDPLNGKLSENADAINRVADAYAAQAKQEAAMEIMQGYYKQQIELQMEMKDAEEAVEEARRKSNEALAAGSELYKQYGDEQILAQQELDRLSEEYDACSENIEYMTDVMADNADQAGSTADDLEAYMKTTRKLGDAMTEAGVDSSGLMDALAQLGVSTTMLSELTDEELIELAGSYDGTLTSISGRLAEFGIDAGQKGKQAGSNFADGMSGTSWMALQAASEVAGVSAEELARLAYDAGVSGDNAIASYANAIRSGMSPSQAAADAVEGAAAGELSSLRYSTYSWGAEAADNFAAGVAVQRAKDAALQAARELAGAISSILGHSVPKAGPLRAGGKGEKLWGEHAATNFAEGFEDASPRILAAAASAMTGVRDILESASAAGWSFADGLPGLSARGGEGRISVAASLDALGAKVDSMADRIERAIGMPSELTVDRREFGRLVKEVV